jgi:hypothetical protein
MRMTKNPPQADAGGRSSGLPRTAVILLAGLAALLITAGLAGGWFFTQMEGKYSMLIARTAEDLNDVHDIAFHSGVGYANLLELSLNPDPQRRAELRQALAAERAANDRVFDDLRRTVTGPEIRSGLEEVIARREACRKAGDAFIASCQSGVAAEVKAASSHQFLLAFDDYQKSCDKLGDLIQANALQTGGQVSAQIERLRLLFFGVAVVPLGLALVVIALTLWLIWQTPMEVELRDASSCGDFTHRAQPPAAVKDPEFEPENGG